MKTSTTIMKYESQVVKLNPGDLPFCFATDEIKFRHFHKKIQYSSTTQKQYIFHRLKNKLLEQLQVHFY